MREPKDDPALLAAIGRVTVETGRLEQLLAEIGDLLVNPKEPWVGKAFTTDVPLNRLIDAVVWLYSERQLPDPRRFKSILDSVFTLAQERNRVVHSRWILSAVLSGFPVLPIRTRIESRNRKGPTYKVEDFTEGQINQLADRIAKVTSDLIPFWKHAVRLSGLEM